MHEPLSMSRVALIVLTAWVVASCAGPTPPQRPPNVLWILWDTVRADRLSLYGHGSPTTPFLDDWTRQARVFDDCVSPGTITSTSHASLFTGLLPSEHGSDNRRTRLHPRLRTLPEILEEQGYRTFLWSANPHIGAEADFDQGFDRVLHPWSEGYRQRAREIVESKVQSHDHSSELPAKLATPNVADRVLSASGRLAQETLLEWLAESDGAPYFAFLNYMEAHRPLIPPERFRRRLMPTEDVARSYQIDRGWNAVWSYTFGLTSFADDELRVMRGTYDAAVAELDELFRDLITALEAEGHLDDTVVVLTSDHGEHLGEHHLLDHQYSVYDPLLRVPLVLHAPGRVPAGRESRPVMSFDLFPTLLELCGIEPPEGSQARSLLRPQENRPRLAEYTAPFPAALRTTRERHPDWPSARWEAQLRALTHGDYKLIARDGEASELYRLDVDPGETRDLAGDEPERRARLEGLLARHLAALSPRRPGAEPPAAFSEEHRERLRALGYLDGGDPSPDDATAANPAGRP